MEDESEPVQVFVRIRPESINSSDGRSHPLRSSGIGGTSAYCVAKIDQQTIRLGAPDGAVNGRKSVSAVDDKVYSFDRVFADTATQDEVYDSVSSHVLATVRGYNSTIFAYGVTGSGKSFTMSGNRASPGIIPRAIGDIFRHIDAAAAENDIYFFVRLSYVELYNNNFRNLLENIKMDTTTTTTSTSVSATSAFQLGSTDESTLDDDGVSQYGGVSVSQETGSVASYARQTTSTAIKETSVVNHRGDKIEVRESTSAGVYLSGPNLRFTVTSSIEAFKLIAAGNKNRATASTNCNESSSRSHAILTFHVESRLMNHGSTSPSDATNTSTSSTFSASAIPPGKNELRIGKIHLVDLAGSERLGLSGAEGEQLVETKNINYSLSALGDVLSALSKNAAAMAQHQQRSSSSSYKFTTTRGGDLQAVTIADTRAIPLVPVPYRNSKLTHLLKDSLGGNSKTVMIATIRQAAEYYQMTAVSLMYASRAKKVRNRSTINRNVLGTDGEGIHAVSTEMERLKVSLEERSLEFERLRKLQLQDQQENHALKMRLVEMQRVNETEKAQLEKQVGKLIHSQAGYIASQKEKISHLQGALQEELAQSQVRIAAQDKEILHLRRALDEQMSAANASAVAGEQFKRLQRALDTSQNAAKTATNELAVVLRQAEELKTLNLRLETRAREAERSRNQLLEEISERTAECAEMSSSLMELTRSRETTVSTLHRTESELNKARHQITDLEVSISQNSGKMGKLQSRLSELEKENRDLSERLRRSLEMMEEKSAAMIADANRKLAMKQAMATDAVSAKDMLTQELTLTTARLSEMEIKFTSTEKRLTELQALLQEREIECESLRKHHTQDAMSSTALIESLRGELAAAHAAAEEAKEQRDLEYEAVVNEFERVASERRQTALNTLAEKEQQNSLLSEELKLLRERLSKLEAEREEAISAAADAVKVAVAEAVTITREETRTLMIRETQQTLESTRQNSEAEINKLTERISSLQSELTRMQSITNENVEGLLQSSKKEKLLMDRLKTEKEESATRILQLEGERNELLAQLAALEISNQQRMTEALQVAEKMATEAVSSAVLAGQTQILALQAEIESSRREYLEMSQSFSVLETELSSLREIKIQSENSLTSSESELTSARQSISSLQQSLYSLEEELSATRQELSNSQSRLNISESELTALRISIESSETDAQATARETREALRVAEDNLLDSKEELRLAQVQIMSLKQDIQETREAALEAKTSAREVEDKFLHTQEDLRIATEEIHRLVNILKERESEIVQVKDTAFENESKRLAERLDMETKMATVASEVVALTESRDKALESLSRAEQIASDQTLELASTKQELLSCQAKLSTLSDVEHDLQLNVDRLEHKLAEALKKLTENELELNNSQVTVASLQNDNLRLKNELIDANNDSDNLRKELKNAKNKCDDLEVYYEKTKAELSQLYVTMQSTESEVQAELSTNRDLLAVARDNVTKLQVDLEVSQHELSAAEAKILELQLELSDSCGELSSTQASLRSVEDSLRESNKHACDLSSELEKEKEIVASLRGSLSEIQDRLSLTESDRDKLADSLSLAQSTAHATADEYQRREEDASKTFTESIRIAEQTNKTLLTRALTAEALSERLQAALSASELNALEANKARQRSAELLEEARAEFSRESSRIAEEHAKDLQTALSAAAVEANSLREALREASRGASDESSRLTVALLAAQREANEAANTARSEIRELRSAVAEERSARAAAESELSNSQSVLAIVRSEAQASAAATENEITLLKRELSDVQDSLNMVDTERESLLQRLTSAEADLEACNFDLSSKEELLSEKEAELLVLKEALAEANNQLSEYKESLSVKESMYAELEISLLKLNGMLSSKDQELIEKEDEVRRLNEDLIKSNECKISLETLLEKNKQSLLEVEESLSQSNEYLVHTEKSLQETKKELFESERTVSDYKNSLISTESALLESEAAVANLKEILVSKDKELDAKDNYLSQKEHILSEAERTLTEKDKNLALLEDELSQAKMRICALEQELNHKDVVVSDEVTRVAKLAEEHASVTNQLIEMTAKFDTLSEEFSKLTTDHTVLQSTLSALKEEASLAAATAEVQLLSCTAKYERLLENHTSDLMSNWGESIVKFSQLVNFEEQLKFSTENSEESLKFDGETILTSLRRHLDAKQEEISDLNTKVDEMVTQLSIIQLAAQTASSEALTARQDCELAENNAHLAYERLETLENKHKELEREFENVSAAILKTEEESAALRSTCEELEDTLKNTRDRLCKVEADLVSAENELSVSSATLLKTNEELRVSNEIRSGLEADAKKCSEELRELRDALESAHEETRLALLAMASTNDERVVAAETANQALSERLERAVQALQESDIARNEATALLSAADERLVELSSLLASSGVEAATILRESRDWSALKLVSAQLLESFSNAVAESENSTLALRKSEEYVAELESKLESLRIETSKKIFELETSLVDAHSLTEELVKKTTLSAKESVTEAENLVSKLQIKLENLEDTLLKTSKSAQDQILSLEDKVSSLESSLESSRAQVTTLESSLESSRAQVTTLESSLESSRAQVTTLESSLESSRAQVTTLESSLESLRIEVSTLKVSLESSRSQVANLETTLATTEANLLTSQQSMASLQTTLTTKTALAESSAAASSAESRRAYETLSAAHSERNRRLAELAAENQALNDSLRAAAASAADMEATCAAEKSAAQAMERRLTSELDTLRRRLSIAETAASNASQEVMKAMESASRATQDHENRIEALRSENLKSLRVLRSQLTTAEARIVSLTHELDLSGETISSLRTELTSIKASEAVASVVAASGALNKTNDTAMNALSAELEEAKGRLHQLETQKRRMEESFVEREQALQRELQQLRMALREEQLRVEKMTIAAMSVASGHSESLLECIHELVNLVRSSATPLITKQSVDGAERLLENRFSELIVKLSSLISLPSEKEDRPLSIAELPSPPAGTATTLPPQPQYTSLQVIAPTNPPNIDGKGINSSIPTTSSGSQSETSPEDQLVAAILDGDVQGVRLVIRRHGDDLRSTFWDAVVRPLLPLHRAVSGLRIHGSESALLATLDTLCRLGADISSTDAGGNTALHRAVTVCTSKSVAAVVACLLSRGADAAATNHDGDSPLHLEIKRLRSASPIVIELLVRHGANPNQRTQHWRGATPLTILLTRAATLTQTGSVLAVTAFPGEYLVSIAGTGDENEFTSAIKNLEPSNNGTSWSPLTTTTTATAVIAADTSHGANDDNQRQISASVRLSWRRQWVKTASSLLHLGASWDPQWKGAAGVNQLHLLTSAFPPCREDISAYTSLLRAALESGLSPASCENITGRSALAILCDAMAVTPSSACPESSKLLSILAEKTPLSTVTTVVSSYRQLASATIPSPSVSLNSGVSATQDSQSCLAVSFHILSLLVATPRDSISRTVTSTLSRQSVTSNGIASLYTPLESVNPGHDVDDAPEIASRT